MSSLSSRTSSSTFTSPSSSRPTTPGPDSLFDIASTRSGYLGAFASCDISKGTLVLSERPLFTVDAPLEAFLFNRSQGGNGPTPPDGEEEEAQAETFEEFLDQGIRRKVAAKNEDQRRAFWDLANTHDELPPALGIFTTNAVSTVAETGGMFLTLSRFNSACRPNLSRPVFVDAEIRISALHDIQEGQELGWPYLGVPFEFDPIASRRAEMLRVFGFECDCDACSACGLSEAAKVESEDRLLRLRHLKERMGGETGWSRAGMEMVEELTRVEGLWETAERLRERVASGELVREVI